MAIIDELKKVLEEKVVKQVMADIKTQEDRLKELNPKGSPLAFEVSERFIIGVINRALTTAVLEELRAKLIEAVLSGKGQTRRNPVAIA